MDKKKRIGIMGGTFNPIHYGHLIIAENAYEQFGLDQVIFMPTGHMPHKKYGGVEMTKHRCEMVKLATEDNEHFSVSTYEVERKEINYTYLTLQEMHKLYSDANLYFILGADSLFSFDTWKCPEQICANAVILAAVRDHLTESKVDEQIDYLKVKYGSEIYRLETPNFNVSSNIIRTRLKNHETIRYMVPDQVRAYIEEHHLYASEMTLEEIQTDLQTILRPSRYMHTMGVLQTAKELAEKHGCDLIKSQYAALLHDCAKCIDEEEQIRICRKYGVSLTESEYKNHSLLHAKSGIVIAKDKYGVSDEEILHAICYHTTGCVDMSLLDKIVYIADYIEPNRNQAPRLEEIRKLAFEDIDKALFYILEDTVTHLQESNKTIDETTYQAYMFYKNVLQSN